MDTRLALVGRWLGEVLDTAPRIDIEHASEEASSRRYLRVRAGGNAYIVMDAPSGRPDLDAWIDIRARLAGAALTVPELYAADPERGLLLISDLGTRHYLEELAPDRADALYADAIAALMTMQSRVSCDGLPAYDAVFLRRELDLFEVWFLRRHLEVRVTRGERDALEQCFDVLIAACLEQERVFVHRDYHSRNLMVRPRDNPGILDFQGAVRGPIAYDVVSLFRDVYVSWPEERVAGWVSGAYEAARGAGLLRGVSPRRFRRWCDLAGVQRHLKIAGIFSRLHYRDAKPGYLSDIPLTLSYLRTVSTRYPALRPLQALIEERELLPRLDARNASVAAGAADGEATR